MTRSFVQALEGRLLLSGVSVVPAFQDAVQHMAIAADNGSLVAQFGKVNLPPNAVAGARLGANVPVVLSASGGTFKGTAQITFYADTTTSLDGNQVSLGSVTRRVSLGSRGTTVNFRINSLPATLPADTYYILADVEDSSGGSNVIATTQTINVAQPDDSLTPESAVVHAGGGGTANGSVKITNTGNAAPAGGKSMVEIYSSPDGSSEDTLLTTISLALPLRANQSRVVGFHLNANEQAQAANDGYIIFDVYDPSGNDQIYGIADTAPQTNANVFDELYTTLNQGDDGELYGSETFTRGSSAGQTDDSVQISISGMDIFGNITGVISAGFTLAPRAFVNAKVTASGRFSAKIATSVATVASMSGQFSIDQSTGTVTLTGTFSDSSDGGTFTASG